MCGGACEWGATLVRSDFKESCRGFREGSVAAGSIETQ
ncbi:MAG: hypothetical protein K0S00_529 [Xanthobacteraceae bacterium]|jgi:hypothetical protein|nr:hypothetical protein [Xanthobacteraceae bacterium]